MTTDLLPYRPHLPAPTETPMTTAPLIATVRLRPVTRTARRTRDLAHLAVVVSVFLTAIAGAGVLGVFLATATH